LSGKCYATSVPAERFLPLLADFLLVGTHA
jgi:hypothetical protein